MTDIINGIFELIGGIFVILHIVKTRQDRMVKGVSIPSVVYFTSWGIWNVYFYPINGLWFSFAGGIIIAIANVVWIIHLIYYGKSTKQT